MSNNSLKVTRVGGVGALISGAGGAALLLFKVNKSKDPHPIVVAAYISVGVIVAAALVAVAMIIVADIRARAGLASAASLTRCGVSTPGHDQRQCSLCMTVPGTYGQLSAAGRVIRTGRWPRQSVLVIVKTARDDGDDIGLDVVDEPVLPGYPT